MGHVRVLALLAAVDSWYEGCRAEKYLGAYIQAFLLNIENYIQ